MEATKKKKAYLKPEMNRFEMKMEDSFMIVSKEITDTPEVVKATFLEKCFQAIGGPKDLIDRVANGSIGYWEEIELCNTPNSSECFTGLTKAHITVFRVTKHSGESYNDALVKLEYTQTTKTCGNGNNNN